MPAQAVTARRPTDERTAKHRLIDILLVKAVGCDVITYMTRRREAGAIWRQIAVEVSNYTGVDVTQTSLAKWHDLGTPNDTE